MGDEITRVRERERETERDRERQRETERDRERQRETERETERERERDRKRDRERDRERDKETEKVSIQSFLCLFYTLRQFLVLAGLSTRCKLNLKAKTEKKITKKKKIMFGRGCLGLLFHEFPSN